jgi:ABC-type sugar transport system ATPase subunit
MNVLSINSLKKSFGNQQVLKEITFDVLKGQLLAIVGPSGVGKTTLLRIIAGLERPDSGTILINNIEVEGKNFIKPQKRNISYVFQNAALFPSQNVLNNVAMVIKSKQKNKLAKTYLELLKIEHKAKKYPFELSGGEQKRVAIARALAAEPNLILMDEPFASIDESSRQSIRSDIKEVFKSLNISAVMVTHDIDEALSFPDVLAVLLDGTIEQTGSPFDIYKNPKNIKVAKFLGHRNFIKATIKDHKAISAIGEFALKYNPNYQQAILLIPAEDISVLPDPTSNIVVKEIKANYFGHDWLIELNLLVDSNFIHTIYLRSSNQLTIPTGTQVKFLLKEQPKIYEA